MNYEYRRQLPAPVQALVDEIEGHIGREIGVSRNPQMGCGARANPKAVTIEYRDELTTENMLHELLHLRRQLVNGIPVAGFPSGTKVGAPEGAPEDSESVMAGVSWLWFDLHVEHAAIFETMREMGYPEDLSAYRAAVDKLGSWDAPNRRLVAFGLYLVLMRHGTIGDRNNLVARLIEFDLLNPARELDTLIRKLEGRKVDQIVASVRAARIKQACIQVVYYDGKQGTKEVLSVEQALEREARAGRVN
jgi:hypothetical protein